MEHTYKLTYFDFRGLGELIRYVFKYANVQFEDNRLRPENWGQDKPKYQDISLGQLPVLELDGKIVMTQSLAITRYLCKKFGIVAKDELLNYRADEVAHIVEDCRLDIKPLVMKLIQTPDDPTNAAEAEKLRKDVIPMYIKLIEKIVGGSGGPFVAGKDITLGDFVLCNWLEIWEDLELIPLDFLDSYPHVKGVKEEFFSVSQIKQWVETRPKSKWDCRRNKQPDGVNQSSQV